MVSLLGGFIPYTHTVEKGNPVKHRAQLPDGGDGRQWAQPVDVEPGARVEKVSRQYQARDGRVVTLKATVWLPGSWNPQVGDLLVIDGEERPIEVVDTPVWLDGTPMQHEIGTS